MTTILSRPLPQSLSPQQTRRGGGSRSCNTCQKQCWANSDAALPQSAEHILSEGSFAWELLMWEMTDGGDFCYNPFPCQLQHVAELWLSGLLFNKYWSSLKIHFLNAMMHYQRFEADFLPVGWFWIFLVLSFAIKLTDPNLRALWCCRSNIITPKKYCREREGQDF